MKTDRQLFNKICIYLKFEGIKNKQDLTRAFLELYPLGFFMLDDNCGSFVNHWKYAKNETFFTNEIFEKIIEIADDYHNENKLIF